MAVAVRELHLQQKVVAEEAAKAEAKVAAKVVTQLTLQDPRLLGLQEAGGQQKAKARVRRNPDDGGGVAVFGIRIGTWTSDVSYSPGLHVVHISSSPEW